MIGRIWFDADGDGGNDDGGRNGNGSGQNAGQQNQTPPKFTQADVDRIVGERARRAGEAAVNELLKTLGFEKFDDLKVAIDARNKQEAQMADLQKALADSKRKADEAESSGQAALTKAQETLMRAQVLVEASKPDYHIRPDALNDVWTFIDRKAIKPKENSDDGFEGIETAIKSVIEAKPFLVEQGAPIGTPRSGAGRTSMGKDEQTALVQRKAATKDYQVF